MSRRVLFFSLFGFGILACGAASAFDKIRLYYAPVQQQTQISQVESSAPPPPEGEPAVSQPAPAAVQPTVQQMLVPAYVTEREHWWPFGIRRSYRIRYIPQSVAVMQAPVQSAQVQTVVPSPVLQSYVLQAQPMQVQMSTATTWSSYAPPQGYEAVGVVEFATDDEADVDDDDDDADDDD